MDDSPESWYAMVGRIPDEHQAKPLMLKNIGCLFKSRFQTSRNPVDIDNAISAFQKAVTLVRSSDARFSEFMHDLGSSLVLRHDRHGKHADIDKAVSVLNNAIRHTPSGHPDLLARLTSHAVALQGRFEGTGDLEDIHEAISTHQKCLRLISEGHTDMPMVLINLGNAFLRRFERTGETYDIKEAISMQRKAVDLTPDGHTRMSRRLTSLGLSLQRCFERTGDLKCIHDAISVHQKAVSLTPDSHPDKCGILNNLAIALRCLFKYVGSSGDLDELVSLRRKALALTPDDHANAPLMFANLGSALSTRFEHTGDIGDLEEAILMEHKAVSLTPEGYTELPRRLYSLGESVRHRFERIGDLVDINKAILLQQKAVTLTPNGHGNLPERLGGLGVSFLRRFEHTGIVEDIEEAILYQEKAIALITHDHKPDLPLKLSNLGLSYIRRFKCTGRIGDIEEAISLQQKAVNMMPDDHPEMPNTLDSLAGSLDSRFRHTKTLRDIDEAISLRQKALKLTSHGHASMAGRLNNLGGSFVGRFEQTGILKDIDQAISMHEEALNATPDGDANMPLMFNSLASSIRRRFKHGGDSRDIERTVSLYKKAICLLPDGHVHMPGILSNLGGSLSDRFAERENVEDVEEAISIYRRAVNLLPDGYTDMPRFLNGYGKSLLQFFGHTKDHQDLMMGISQFRRAATLSTGPPSVRIISAYTWGSLCSSFDSSQALDAYAVAIGLLPQVAWLGETINNRYKQIGSISNLSNAAAAAAFSCGKLETALEWLEQGRCIVWNQLNNLRTPLDDLRKHHPELAQDILLVSKALDRAGSRTDVEEYLDASMTQKMSIQAEVKAQQKAAEEWNTLIKRIRNLKGFEDFLQPLRCSQIMSAVPPLGYVVVINVHLTRCDALVFGCNDRQPHHILLDQLSYGKAESLRLKLRQYLLLGGVLVGDSSARAGRLAPEPIGGVLHYILSELWTCVVKPVLDIMNISSLSGLSRIWWCATGPLAFLPIHAAGIYGTGNTSSGPSILDLAVSSYIPNVSALLPSNRKVQEKYYGLLAISQPNTPNQIPIPNTTEEVVSTRSQFEEAKLKITCLEGDDATTCRVLEEMERHSWIHFACHAVQNAKESTRSAFYLHNGELELAEIIKKSFTNADFAFLSACQTGTGDENLSEEAVHLAAGMLAAGYRSVIATMWPIKDAHGPAIAHGVYSRLLDNKTKEGPDSRYAAYALLYSTKRLRESLGETEASLLSWVPYIHVGV